MAVEMPRHHRLNHIFGPDLTAQMPSSAQDLPTKNLSILFNRYSKPIPEETVRRLARIRTNAKIDRGESFDCDQEWFRARGSLEDMQFRRFLDGLPIDFYN